MLTTLEFYLILICHSSNTYIFSQTHVSTTVVTLDALDLHLILTLPYHCNSYCPLQARLLQFPLPSSQINQLQVIQNSLARAVTKTPRFCHISPFVQSLHWLKIEQRIIYKLKFLTYTALQHNSPSYLANKLKLQSNRSTRSDSFITLRRPFVKLEKGKHSFSCAAPSLWNSLPTKINQPASDSLQYQHYPETLSTNN